MAPSAFHLSSQLRQIIWYHLDNQLLDNALFHAGRLVGIDARNPDNIHILALCHLRIGQLKAACECSRSVALRGTHLGCSFIFAQSCLGLGQLKDGVHALNKARSLWDAKGNTNKSSETSNRYAPDAAAVQYLLGKLQQGMGDMKLAAVCYVEALRLNPFMWDAFEQLCETGVEIRLSNIFKPTSRLSLPMHCGELSRPPEPQPMQQPAPSQPPRNGFHNIVTPGNDPFNTSKPSAEAGLAKPRANLLSKLNLSNVPLQPQSQVSSDIETPTVRDQDEGTQDGCNPRRAPYQTSQPPFEPPNAPLRKSRLQQPAFNMSSDADTANLRNMMGRGRSKDISESIEAEDGMGVPMSSIKYSSSAHPQKRTISGMNHQASSHPQDDLSAAPQRRSVRLFRKTPVPGPTTEEREQQVFKKARATGTKGRSAASSTVGRVVSGNRKAMPVNHHRNDNIKDCRPAQVRPEPTSSTASVAATTQKRPLDDQSRETARETTRESEAAIATLLELLAKLANGHFALTRYQAKEALQHFQALPTQHRNTPWVLARMGKAYYERCDYEESEKHFRHIRKDHPTHLDSMEIYSTVLWHSKKDAELAYLAHELADLDRLSPQAWVTIGNSFSLQRDHDQAIKCFRRASQLKPSFAYAFTLQGHEHAANEEFEKAKTAYQHAVAADSRHYNAFFGLARMFETQGHLDLAERHFSYAARLNPHNWILLAAAGTALQKQHRHEEALPLLTRAVVLSPRPAQASFKRARSLKALGYVDQALAEFEGIRDLSPHDANAHFMLGRMYKQAGEKGKAIRSLMVALNIDPKAQPLIKETLESLDDDRHDDYDEDDDQMLQ